MEAKEAVNRRKYTRIGTDQVISFSKVQKPEQLAVAGDVSAGGIRFQAIGCEIDLGDTIRVTFNVGENTVEAVGKVAWATELDPITLDVGLEFVEIDPVALELLERGAELGTPA